jgi:FolB domain-containing protein
MQNMLVLKNFQLPVTLGWTAAERRQKQTVSVEIAIQRATPPRSCKTDRLNDTVCYAALIRYLQKSVADREFHLLEYLTTEIFHLLRKILPKTAKLQVSVTKFPSLEGLAGGVSFSYGQLACR